MRLAEIWRYPVKSMAGERLAAAELRSDGIEGDRRRAGVGRAGPDPHRSHSPPPARPPGDDRRGRRAARRRASAGRDPEVTRRVEAAAGRGVRLRRFEGEERFDILPLLVATDGSLAAFGRDPRRLRPNLVIAGVEGLAEREWEGRTLRVGRAVVGLADLRGRCVMTTWDPDTQAQDVGVLRDIARRFDGRLCLNAAVLTPGRIETGDPVEILGPWEPDR